MVLATSRMCLCFCSTTLFCWDIWEQEFWWIISFLKQKIDTSFLTYSKALSGGSTRIEVKNWFFILLKKSSITLETFDISFRRYIHVMREKSSTKSKKYLKPLMVGTRLGPQTSEWTNSNAKLLRLLTRLWKVARWCLPNSQESQPKKEIEDSIGITDQNFCTKGWPKR